MTPIWGAVALAMISAGLQDDASDLPRSEPVVCKRSERNPASNERLWCPGELNLQIPRTVLAAAPIPGVGSGWALLQCEVGEAGATVACRLLEESEPGTRFGRWAVRAQSRAVAVARDDGPWAGDQYYAFARWELR